MRFLRQSFLRCVSWIRRERQALVARENPEELPVARELGPPEVVTRFICSDRHIRRTQSRPKPGVFNPSPYIELSVVHSSGLSDQEVWELGKQTLGSEPGRDKICGRADVPVQSLLDVKLRALRDDNPFKRHTSILDWPLGFDANETKAFWKQICLELSEDIRVSLALPAAPIANL